MTIAGPWVGEFGWELFCWQGYLRALNDMGGGLQEMIVVSRPNSRALYEDFATGFIGVDTSIHAVADCALSDYDDPCLITSNDNLIRPSNDWFYWGNPIKISGYHDRLKPRFVKYGTKDEDHAYDIVLCPRARVLAPERNWSRKNWNDLVSLFPGARIAAIGTTTESWTVDNVDNLRGMDLGYVMNVLASSKIAVGPSSGTMHLAGLCGCPRLVFNEMEQDHVRYTDHWNPFKTPTEIISRWQPTVKEVKERIIGN